MLNDFFINTLLLISFTFILGHILKDIPQELLRRFCGKILLGMIGGLLGILLMLYSIKVDNTNTLLDLRVFSILMVSYVGGLIPSIVSGIIIGGYRSVYLGVNISSIIAIYQIILYIIAFALIDKKIRTGWKRWAYKNLIAFIILILPFFYLLKDVIGYKLIIFKFSLLMIVAGVLEFFLLEYVSSSNELYRRYKKESTRDFLTGIYNRRYFDKMFNVASKKAIENNTKLSCLMIDIDHFKSVNDTYGHAIGDVVIKKVADILVSVCRTFDIIGRVGGEEFCILLIDCPKKYSMDVAVRIRNAIREEKIYIGPNKYIKITVSIGVASYPDSLTDVGQLKEMADIALYNAKHSGRDKVC